MYFLVVDAETTFDYSIPGMDRKRAKDMSEDISDSGKNSKNYSKLFEANSKTTFDYCSPEIDRKRAEDMSDAISVLGKIPKIIPSHLKQIRRLLSTIAVQKWVDIL